MNKVVLIGRLTKDPEQRTTGNGVAVTTFTVAVDRKYKNQDGERQADFINCVAWRSTAEFVAKWFYKGSKIGLSGSLQTRTYDDANGQRKYVTEVVADDVEFVEGKRQAEQEAPADEITEEDLQPIDDEELPF